MYAKEVCMHHVYWCIIKYYETHMKTTITTATMTAATMSRIKTTTTPAITPLLSLPLDGSDSVHLNKGLCFNKLWYALLVTQYIPTYVVPYSRKLS